ncbi:AsmA family protein [uncultured Psychromonas sp.]|uniref:AsmA family protein n=1 Tax=uncultured Psychromonas sp. TaxID=173974 RepID=UPI002638D5DE|nr:AsmA family protein [uncultured Psychromonas sp.]
MKLFLKLAAALIVLLILTVVIVINVVDPNDYKQQIQEQVKKNINRDLVITGELDWSLYPLLGLKSGQVTLYNNPEFEEKTFLNVQNASISINVLPLISGQIEVGEIILDGVNFNLITNKDGSSNLDNLKAEGTEVVADTAKEETPATEEEQSTEAVDLSQFVLSGITLTNAELQVIDHQTNENQKIAIKSMVLSEFAFDKKSHFSLTSSYKNEQVDADIALEADIFIDSTLNNIELTDLTIESEVLSDALADSTLNTTFTSGLTYKVDTKKLDVKAITINNKFTGSYLDGDIYINSSDIHVTNHNELELGKLTLTSSLTGSALSNNTLNTNLQTNLAADIQKQTAKIDQFELKNTIEGKDLQGNLNLSFKEMNVSDFEKILIKQFKLVSELNVPAVSKDKINSTIESEISYDLAKQKLSVDSLQSTVNDIELGGQLSFIQQTVPVIRYSLKGNVWDLNPYLAKTADQEDDAATTEKSEQTAEAEPDLSILKELDIKGDLTIAGLLYEDIRIGKITNNLVVKNGKASISPLNAELYDGSLNIDAWVDEKGGENQYKATTSIKNVVLMDLLKDAAKVDLLSGTANFNLVADGKGLTSTKIQQGVNAKGDFKILDGELYGINLSQEIRVLKAKIQGKTLAPDKLVKKTDFASLIGEFTVQDGIVNNQKLLMSSPVMRLDGTGTANTITEALNYKLGVTPLSKAGEETDFIDLNGVTIPLLIKGTFTKPSFNLDTEAALKEKIEAGKKALQEKAKDAILGNKSSDELKEEAKDLKDKLKSLF